MRKIIKIMFIIFSSIILATGCNKNNDESDLSKLEEKLMKVAEETFLTADWLKGGIEEGTYPLSLKEISEHSSLKLEEYKNPDTGKLCDSEKSKIEFVVKPQKEPDKTNYELKVVLVCD